MKNHSNSDKNNQSQENAGITTSRTTTCSSVTSGLSKEIIAAAGLGHLHSIKWFLEQRLIGAELSGEVLCAAAFNGHVQIVNLILKHGGDVHFNNDHPIFSAVAGEHPAIVKLLLHYGATCTSGVASHAALCGNHQILGSLLSNACLNSDELDEILGIAGATAAAIHSVECSQITIRYCSTSKLIGWVLRKYDPQSDDKLGLKIIKILAHKELNLRRKL